MKNTINELGEIILNFEAKISSIPEAEFSSKPQPTKWSKKEVLGHLIDSAQNNLRRFICGQYETPAPKIVYQQDHWVNANAYQLANSKEIIQLWALLNRRICTILETMPEAAREKMADTGKEVVSLHTLEWLAVDYVKHLKHHLNQIIPKSFDITYP